MLNPRHGHLSRDAPAANPAWRCRHVSWLSPNRVPRQIVPCVGNETGQIGLQAHSWRPADGADFQLGCKVHKARTVIGRHRPSATGPDRSCPSLVPVAVGTARPGRARGSGLDKSVGRQPIQLVDTLTHSRRAYDQSAGIVRRLPPSSTARYSASRPPRRRSPFQCPRRSMPSSVRCGDELVALVDAEPAVPTASPS